MCRCWSASVFFAVINVYVQDDHAAPVAGMADQLTCSTAGSRKAAIIISIWSRATTTIRRAALPTTRASRPKRRSTSSPGILSAFLSAVTFIFVLWSVGGALDFRARRTRNSHPGLSCHRRLPLCDVRHRLDADHRQELRPGIRGPEPARSRISLCADAPARERRKHCAAWRREGGARGAPAQLLGAARKLALRHGSMDAHHVRLVDERLLRGVLPILLCAPKFLPAT